MQKLTSAIVAAAALSVAAFSHAAVIDNFTTTSALQLTTAGPAVHLDTPSAAAIGGSRRSTLLVSAGNGIAKILVNDPIAGVAALDSTTGVDGSFTLTYGALADLNADFSADNAFNLRFLRTDLAGVNNSLTVTTTGSTPSTITFVVPALVGNGGPLSPVDIIIPFNNFTGIDFANVDKLSFNFNLPQATDWQVQLLGTTFIPEPSALALLAPTTLLLTRRRRA